MYSVSLLPHVRLDGVSRQDRFGEASLDSLELGHIVSAIFLQYMPNSNSIGTQAVEDGGLKACSTWWVEIVHSVAGGLDV